MKILYEDKDMLIIHKPAGLATQTARLGQKDLVSEVNNYIRKEDKNSNPYAGVINRLDQPVEGIVLFAKNKKTAALLSEQMKNGSMRKFYQAVIWGHMKETKGRLTDYLEKDARSNSSRVTAADSKEAKKAVLEYSVEATLGKMQLLQIELMTGRHHQIRVQLSSREHPLIGDTKYGTEESIAFGRKVNALVPALCAYKLVLTHPATGKEMCVETEAENPLLKGFVSNLIGI